MEFNTENWIPVTDAERLSGYTDGYIRNLAKQGKIRGQKFGHVWMIDKNSLETYMREQDKKPDYP